MTNFEQYGLELRDMIAERGEEPTLVGVETAQHDALRLYRFSDGTEVIESNAGLHHEDDAGFQEARAAILA